MSKKSFNRPYVARPETLRRAVHRQAVRLKPDDVSWQDAFTDAVISEKAARPALFWLGKRPQNPPFGTARPAGWQPDWTDAIDEPGLTVGRHVLHQEGAYYCLDFSSIFSSSVLLAVNRPVRTVLDLCSAPGGKGIFAWRAFQPEILVCNEVVGKRTGSLIANLERCTVTGSLVTSLDPSQFALLAPHAFDLVVVDAPCSGQSLPAKGDPAPGAYQPNMIAMNMARQRRILANAVRCVAPGGYLAYMTCTYSREENEKNVEWVLRRFPELSTQTVPHLEAHRSFIADFPCYRLFPQEGLGVGGFTALLRRAGDPLHAAPLDTERLRPRYRFGQARPYTA